jgi:hypothetical protein
MRRLGVRLAAISPGVVLATIPLFVFALFCLLYGPLATPPGADVAHYLLGVRHLEAGRWPWGAEPPLSFLVLWPFTVMLGDTIGFVVLGAVLSAVTVWLCGVLLLPGAAAGRQRFHPAPKTLATAMIAQALAFLYGAPQFANCFLKNSLANVLMCLAVLAWLGPGRTKWLAAPAGVLAALAHPGAMVPLGAAACLCLLPDQGELARRAGRARSVAIPARGRRLLLGLGAGTAAAAALAVAVAVWPTFARYAGTYFRPADNVVAPFASWDLGTLLGRYLPLWLSLAFGVAVRLRHPGRGRAAHGPLLRLSWAWVFALAGLGVVGGAVGRRLEIQQFIPLSVLGATYVTSWPDEGARARLEPGLGPAPGSTGGLMPGSAPGSAPGPVPGLWPWQASRRTARAAGAALVMALLFGLGILVSSLHPRPLLNAQEMAALTESGRGLPEGSKLVAFGTDVTYWAEYLTGIPVVGPHLTPERGLVRGPTYLLTENPIHGGPAWSEQALAALRDSGRLTAIVGRFMLLQADDDAAFFGYWSESPRRSSLELLRLDPALWPVEDAPEPGGTWTRIAGWLLFPVSGLLMAVGLNAAFSAAAGLVPSYALWRSLGRAALYRTGFPAVSAPGGPSRATRSAPGPGHTQSKQRA